MIVIKISIIYNPLYDVVPGSARECMSEYKIRTVIKMEREEFLQVYRHSLAHILAKAVFEIFGESTQIAIGPQIDDGMYYDFALPRPVTEEDYKTIEDKMTEILKRKEDWKREEISRNDALELFKDQKYKVEIIEYTARVTISLTSAAALT